MEFESRLFDKKNKCKAFKTAASLLFLFSAAICQTPFVGLLSLFTLKTDVTKQLAAHVFLLQKLSFKFGYTVVLLTKHWSRCGLRSKNKNECKQNIAYCEIELWMCNNLVVKNFLHGNIKKVQKIIKNLKFSQNLAK